jgi:acyl-CoA synthetase (AMP-forming)/AMP-acid ligase II
MHPRGVMVTHRNLLSNYRMMCRSVDRPINPAEPECSVMWMPLFHDMGLIGGVLQSLFVGEERLVMPPEAFLMKPLRWLQALSRCRARLCVSPNFGYELCTQRIKAADVAGLDLSCVDIAYVGAEPVRAGTLERFQRMFEPCGFRPEAWIPSYGLAEATLFVTGGPRGGGFRLHRTSAGSEGGLEVAATASPPAGRTLVGCGRPWLDAEVVIVDPDTRTPCRPEEVGEIWVAGSSVAKGYWNRTEETERTFHARLAGDDGRQFLRTGDLGVILGGDLCVAGRLKDVIVASGRKHHAADIEQTVEDRVDAVRRGGCAAFAVDIHETERLIIVAELQRNQRAADRGAIEDAIREAVAEQHETAPYAVVLVKPATLPRTTSGKLQRHACRTRFLVHDLDEWSLPA